jgi:hypothetical protein
MSEAQETTVDSSLKKRGRPVKGPYSVPSLLVASQKHLRREIIYSILAKKPTKKFDMRFILNKHPGVKISGPKYSIAVPSNALDDLPSDDALDDILNKQVEPVSKCSLALIIDLI